MHMSVFNVPVTIGVDEEKIAREVEKDARSQVIANINEKVEGIIYRSGSYYGRKQDDSPLRNMIIAEVRNILKEKEELIVELAAKDLAGRLARQKAVKEMAMQVTSEVAEEDK